MRIKSIPVHRNGIYGSHSTWCLLCLPRFSVLFLVILLHEADARSAACSDFCDFEPYPNFSNCIDARSCIERVNHENKVYEMFADDVTSCYKAQDISFPVSIESISAQVLNKILSINISWQWPHLDMKNGNDYQLTCGLKYVITTAGERRTSCYNILLSEEQVHSGKFNVPCMKFRDDGFSAVEFNITFMAFMIEKFRSDTIVMARKLQEISIGKTENVTDVTIPVWNPQMKYRLANSVLAVSFTPAPDTVKYTSYDVRIFKAQESKCLLSESFVDRKEVVPSWPATYVNFSSTNYEECAKYCVSVHPVINSPEGCSTGCVKGIRDIIQFEVPPRILDCQNWNADFTFQAHPLQNELDFTFDVCCGYDFCFEKFSMMLFSPFQSSCKPPGRTVDRKTFYWNSSATTITFENVAPGNYCARVSPIHEICYRYKDICSARYTGVKELVEPYALPLDMSVSESPVQNQVLMISVVSVIGFCVLITVAGILWWRSRPPTEVEIDIKGFHYTENSELLDMPHLGAHNIVILYTHDELTRRRVRALADFLKNFLNVEVLLDEDHLAKITADHSSFISEALKYSCPHNGGQAGHSDNKRIIIVKSKRAIKLLRKKANIMEDVMKLSHNSNEAHCESDAFSDDEELPNIYERLDMLFLLGISSIERNRHNLTDDCHIFVVQFNESVLPGSEIFDRLFPGNRYHLPTYLGDLCLNLHKIDYPRDPTDRFSKINQMCQEWENNSSYKELLAACSR